MKTRLIIIITTKLVIFPSDNALLHSMFETGATGMWKIFKAVLLLLFLK